MAESAKSESLESDDDDPDSNLVATVVFGDVGVASVGRQGGFLGPLATVVFHDSRRGCLFRF